jgi:hypothetical protein
LAPPKLEIQLNPEEEDTVSHLAKMDDVVASATTEAREQKSAEMLGWHADS